jgi:hypothetical protein
MLHHQLYLETELILSLSALTHSAPSCNVASCGSDLEATQVLIDGIAHKTLHPRGQVCVGNKEILKILVSDEIAHCGFSQ